MSVIDFQPVIGLEVHAQLLTASKIFSTAPTAFGAEPNSQTQPVCLGMPGALPVLNAKVVELAVRAGLALGCEIRRVSEWSRKHYFYPDLPKGYQITQYDQPICSHGTVGYSLNGEEKSVRILRIHLEEDAGKSTHDGAGHSSLVDLNRAGTALLEIVSEPDLRSADEAVEYLRVLRDILMAIGVNDGNLEEGSFRCDANVSVMKKGATVFGTRCELKNLNSFRFIKQAIEYEIGRHVEVIESGGRIEQQTRLFDTQRGETRAMRGKEDAHDYRYFPDPDLPLLTVSEALIEKTRAALPELPRPRRARMVKQYGVPEKDVAILTTDLPLTDFFEACATAYAGEGKKVSNWFIGELARLRNETPMAVADFRFTPQQLAELLDAVDAGTISNNAAREVFAEMYRSGARPAEVIAAKGLGQVSDTGATEAAVLEVMARCASEVASYRAGKTALLGFLVGQVMKSMKGKGNPKLVNQLLVAKLGG